MVKIPSSTADLPLREYSAEMEDLFARVWLNPSLAIVRQRADLVRRTLDVMKSDIDTDAKMAALDELRPLRYEWLVAVLGHGEAAERRWLPSLAEINGSYEAAPDFVIWLVERVSSMLDAHRDREKKS